MNLLASYSNLLTVRPGVQYRSREIRMQVSCTSSNKFWIQDGLHEHLYSNKTPQKSVICILYIHRRNNQCLKSREKCVEFYVLLICLRIKEEAQAKHNTSIQKFFQIFPSDICKNLLQRPNCKIWFCNLQAIKNVVGWTKRTVPFQTFYNFWCNF